MKPVRILHVFYALGKGGAESRIMDIYREIDRNRVQFDFAIHTNDRYFFESEIESLGGRIYYGMPRYRIANFLKCRNAWKSFFSDHEYECIHVHALNLAPPVLSAAKQMGIKWRICHARNSSEISFLRRLSVILFRAFIRRLSTHMFAVSDLAGRFRFGSGYVVKKNAIQAEQFTYDIAKREEIRQSLGIQDSFVLGCVGRFHGQKNHEFLLEIFADLVKSLPQAVLILIGDGALRPRLEIKISQLGLSDVIILLGLRDDIPDLLQALDIFLMPSLFEGLPGAALEAQAAGLPCLLSDSITSEAKIVDDLVTYLSITNGTKPWVERIVRAAEEPHVRRDTQENFIKQGYDIVDVARWYEEFYIELD